MEELASRTCAACHRGVPRLQRDAIPNLIAQLKDWEVVGEHHLRKAYKFDDFRAALAFVNLVGGLSEEQRHHPDVCCGWGYAEIKIWTHAIDGLSESDFILAAKIDKL